MVILLLMNIFPYSKIREIQKELIEDVENCLKDRKNLIVHAPTGLGKTAATLAPALEVALKKDLTVFFLTSRLTQHKIAIETLKEIKNKFNLDFIAVDIIGKKRMCLVPGAEMLRNHEFNEYCEKQIEEGTCEYYANVKNKSKITEKAKNFLEQIKTKNPYHSEEIYKKCIEEKLCAYEISAALAAKASVIVSDYYYLFHPSVSSAFFKRIGKEIKESIIIIDEAHNLGSRVRDLLTERLTDAMLKRAIKEAEKFNYSELIPNLKKIMHVLENYSEDACRSDKSEMLVKKEDFIKKIESGKEEGFYEDLIAKLKLAGDDIREQQQKSFVGSIGDFLESWQGDDDGFARIFSNKKTGETSKILSYRCLDPALYIKPIINNAYCTIAMSGTLTPTHMYKDLFGLENSVQKELKSPFPKENQLSIIIPKTTTRYGSRNEKQFKMIAEICAEITNEVPGNSAIFFPSYEMRDKVFNYYAVKGNKTAFKEEPEFTKDERHEFLEKFKSYGKKGAVLLGAIGGSFSEGIDLPGDLLKCVIIVGLPLQTPDLEIKELIKYYDKKFGKGWDYGYIFPAFNKTMQAAGRCIRSETDRGVIVFLDERYTWSNYRRCFPKDLNLIVTQDYKKRINDFFKNDLKDKK